jgi:hypothetical protein
VKTFKVLINSQGRGLPASGGYTLPTPAGSGYILPTPTSGGYTATPADGSAAASSTCADPANGLGNVAGGTGGLPGGTGGLPGGTGGLSGLSGILGGGLLARRPEAELMEKRQEPILNEDQLN